MKEKQGLLAPESYWKLTDDEKYEITNGCGPARATALIPNRIFGVNLKSACDIHDYTYTRTESVGSRREADDLLLVNMHSLLEENQKSLFLKMIGSLGAGLYYLVVRLLGETYFH